MYLVLARDGAASILVHPLDQLQGCFHLFGEYYPTVLPLWQTRGAETLSIAKRPQILGTFLRAPILANFKLIQPVWEYEQRVIQNYAKSLSFGSQNAKATKISSKTRFYLLHLSFHFGSLFFVDCQCVYITDPAFDD